ncbi:hypothetical protein GCM10011494_19980 [Novosphingobium endophyticum]|uniref:EthD domain-containing protein n=1 Tax=Novosphingobium endophyticum TaxID=1955250 RepID=A0A916TS88_9SPHN|nr:EthD domain-containing protein [Novosphingobium endophyticum]GGC01418.1 hypothetical protein GCM10011494_19980 [Novosphingobium endophyticum]
MSDRYKVALFLTRSDAIGPNEFPDRWLAAGSGVAGNGLVSHIHNAACAADNPIENAPPAPYDAVDEYEFERAGDAAAFFASTTFTADWLGPRRSLLAEPPQVVSGPVRQVWNGMPATPEAVNILTLPVRRAGMAMADFFEYWSVHHAGLALAGQGTRERLVNLASCATDGRVFGGLASAPFDGIGNIVFDSGASLAAEFASDHYRLNMAPDEPRFTDPAKSRAMMVNARTVAIG